MARTVDETEWLTRRTAPLRLVRYARPRASPRKRHVLAAHACRLVARHLRNTDVRRDLALAVRLAFGDLPADALATGLSPVTVELLRTHRQYGDDASPPIAAARAVAAACAADAAAGMVRVFEWVLIAGRDDPALPAALCDLVREVVGNPFRLWHVRPPWLAPGVRVDPSGSQAEVPAAAYALAQTVDRTRRFDLLPVLADELESAGWTDPGLLHHLRHATGHVRGCWAVELVLGRE